MELVQPEGSAFERNLQVTQQELMDRITAAVRGVDSAADVLLYGSRARGEASPGSDWDLLILLGVPVTEDLKREIRHRLYSIEWDVGEVITSIIHSRADWESSPLRDTPFHRRVSQEAVRV